MGESGATNTNNPASGSRALLCCTSPDIRMQTKAGEQGKTLHRKYCYHCGCYGAWYEKSENADYWWPLTVERHLAIDIAIIKQIHKALMTAYRSVRPSIFFKLKQIYAVAKLEYIATHGKLP